MSDAPRLCLALVLGPAPEAGGGGDALRDIAAGTQILGAARWLEQDLAATSEPRGGAPGRQLLLCDTVSGPALTSGEERWSWSGAQLGEGGISAPQGAGALLLNCMNIDAAHEDEFNDWYDTEHLPRIAAVEGVMLARRYRSERSDPRYLACYHLRDLDVVRGEAWKAAALTPWTARMRRHRTGLVRKGFTAL
ncbi:MAG: hypothetical protein CMN73_04840 [Sphingomonas sp.]|nr:hypothetical protein [Sphingomonas sp.]|tara:strand:+ start:2995 stop:3573 length:579 start_codon:yes stop_codon:yes gene_type:complete